MASPRLKSVRCVALRHTARCDSFCSPWNNRPANKDFKLLPRFLSNRPYYHHAIECSTRAESFNLDLPGWASFYCARQRVGGHAEVWKAEDMQCNAMQRKHATPILSRTGIGPEWPRHAEAPTQLARSRRDMGNQGEGRE